MARIVDARKIEVLRDVTLEEYGTKVQFQRDNEGGGYIRVEADDPARKERAALRSFVEKCQAIDAANGVDPDISLVAVIAELNRRDEDATSKYGTKEPNKFTLQLWVDRDIAKVIGNLYAEAGEITRESGETIVKGLTPVNTKGF